LQYADGLSQPTAVLAAVGGTEPAFDLGRHREQLVQLTVIKRGALAVSPTRIWAREADAFTACYPVSQEPGPRCGIGARGADRNASPHDRDDFAFGDLLLKIV
jgi:hypothetical protein